MVTSFWYWFCQKMSQRCFSRFWCHTKLIVAFASGQICDVFRKIRKTLHFGAIFIAAKIRQPDLWCLRYAHPDGITIRGKIKKRLCKFKLYSAYPIFPQFVPIFAHFRGRKIQISKCLPAIPFSISQLSPLNEKSSSTHKYFHASG